MSRYNDAYTEVYEIIELLDKEEYNKIPSEIIKTIKENRNLEYKFKLDEKIELKEQQLLPETKAILFNMFRDYLSTPGQKEIIIKRQAEERKRIEQMKKNEYNSNLFEKKSNISKIEEVENIELIKYKENIFKKILRNIRNFFNLQN